MNLELGPVECAIKEVMKPILICLIALAFISCDSNAPRPVAQNTNAATTSPLDRPQTAISHSSENQAPPASNTGKSKWTQGGDAFDTSEYDSAIAAAEKKLSGKPSDDAAKKALAEAYYKRAVALTDKRQYASALGDYRRTLKYDPSNPDAKEWIDKIIMIYDGLNKESPKEGEEPPPLPYKKGA